MSKRDILITVGEETFTAFEWSLGTGVHFEKILKRLNRGFKPFIAVREKYCVGDWISADIVAPYRVDMKFSLPFKPGACATRTIGLWALLVQKSPKMLLARLDAGKTPHEVLFNRRDPRTMAVPVPVQRWRA